MTTKQQALQDCLDRLAKDWGMGGYKNWEHMKSDFLDNPASSEVDNAELLNACEQAVALAFDAGLKQGREKEGDGKR